MSVWDAVRQFKIEELVVMTQVVGERLELPLQTVKIELADLAYRSRSAV